VNAGGTRTLEAERLFLNLGTHAAIPAIPGLADSQPLTNIEALELDRLPAHFVVIGGGYVGLELAQAYRRFGSRVTILHLEAQVLVDAASDRILGFTMIGLEAGEVMAVVQMAMRACAPLRCGTLSLPSRRWRRV